MQTPATTRGSEQGCEISENDISSEISQNPPLCIPDKHHAAWAFEWKVIRRRACHGSQRRTTSTCNRCLLQRESCQIYFLGVCPSLQLSRQRACLSPPTVRARIWKDCGGGGGSFWGLRFFFFFFLHRLHHPLLPDTTAAGPASILGVHFGCPLIWNSSYNNL